MFAINSKTTTAQIGEFMYEVKAGRDSIVEALQDKCVLPKAAPINADAKALKAHESYIAKFKANEKQLEALKAGFIKAFVKKNGADTKFYVRTDEQGGVRAVNSPAKVRPAKLVRVSLEYAVNMSATDFAALKGKKNDINTLKGAVWKQRNRPNHAFSQMLGELYDMAVTVKAADGSKVAGSRAANLTFDKRIEKFLLDTMLKSAKRTMNGDYYRQQCAMFIARLTDGMKRKGGEADAVEAEQEA